MEERGFDALQHMPALLFGSTILLLAVIYLGGLWFRSMEMRWREKNEQPPPDDGPAAS